VPSLTCPWWPTTDTSIAKLGLIRFDKPPSFQPLWWYQYYFATERGRAGYDKCRRDFAKLIWQIASPKRDFDDATFDRAASFDSPDHVAIVIHNYRWRLGLADGEPKYDKFKQQLAQASAIDLPMITLEGDANGAPHPDPSAYANKFSGKYEHRTIKGGIGHNLPQEVPRAFAQAIIDVDRFWSDAPWNGFLCWLPSIRSPGVAAAVFFAPRPSPSWRPFHP
jgi:hypothetical protein